MIVRNEADTLPRCLRSVEKVVDEIVIVDTGSSDETIEIARDFGARVKTVPWKQDFAWARNQALDLAQGKWILHLDADEELQPTEDNLEHLHHLLADETYEAYIFQIVSPLEDGQQMKHEIVRLWRNRKQYRYQGAVHEQILPSILQMNPEARIGQAGLEIIHHGYSQNERDQTEKARRNLAILRRTIEENEDDLFAKYNLGISQLQLGNYQEACTVLGEVYEQIKGTENWIPSLVRAYALALERNHNLDEALEVLENGIDLWSDYTELLYLQGFIYLHKHLYNQAINCWQQCVLRGDAPSRYVSTEGAGSYLAYEQLGLLYMRLREYPQAINAFTSALRSKSDFSRVLYHLAQALKMSNYSHDQVLDYLETHFHFVNPQARILLADVLAHVGATEQALRQIDRALNQLPPTDSIRRLRGYLLLRLSRFQLALNELERIQKGSPEFIPTRWYICFCQWLQEPPVKADVALQQLAEAGKQQESIVLREFQRLICGGGDRSTAYEHLPDEIKVTCCLRLVEALLEVGFPHRADVAAEMMGGIVQEKASLRLGKLFYRFGETGRAAHWLLNGLEERNYDPESLKMLGEITYEKDLFEDAEQLFAEALSIDADNLETHLDIVKVYLQQAKKILERGQTFIPGSTLIKEELMRVEECLKWL